MNYINKDNIDDFCITNIHTLSCDVKDVRGLCVEFPGFDGNSCLSGNFNFPNLGNDFATRLGKNGILLIYVFTGPWNWMRDVSIKTTDDIIAAVIEKYSLKEDIKITLTGGSMGGLGVLAYAAKGKYKAVSCSTSCPVCDLFSVSKFSHFFAASVYFAVCHMNTDYESAVKEISPIYFVDKLPDVPYFLIWCDKDDVVLPEDNAIPLISKMKAQKLNLKEYLIEGAGHCQHTGESIDKLVEFITQSYALRINKS